ncbi:MAG: TDP-4-oxo-6-deoxy-alpha-D-glucose-3,4-oxoisomerase [Bacteroidia bacterium]|nr:TDP-4-oxo-6-deoxy-alpha-D-glucose-3,4-oxoisomerase [Bacteroidia bacterium]
MKKPEIIAFDKIDNKEKGVFSIVNSAQIPFEIKRVFWIFGGDENRIAGEHAHKNSEQVIVALQGKINISTETKSGEKQNFILDESGKALYIPALCWQKIEYIGKAALLCFSSSEYNPDDYIRTYKEFKEL